MCQVGFRVWLFKKLLFFGMVLGAGKRLAGFGSLRQNSYLNCSLMRTWNNRSAREAMHSPGSLLGLGMCPTAATRSCTEKLLAPRATAGVEPVALRFPFLILVR